MKIIKFVLGEKYIKFYSKIIRKLLLAKGIKVGKNLRIEGLPNLTINGNPNNIVIGDNVIIRTDVDIKIRENGSIKIGDNCKIDRGVRLLAANDALLDIGSGTNVGFLSVINSGANVKIGKKCLIAGYVNIQSSEHGIKKGKFIKDQQHTHEKITIGDDVWLGSHVTVLKGITIESGAVIGTKSVVNGNIGKNEIYAGVPAKKIGSRK